MAKVFDSVSSRAFPEVLLARRAALRAFLVVVMGRFSRGPFRKIYFIFSQPIFLPDLSFFFSVFLAIHFPVFVTFTVFRLPHDTRHPPPPYCTRLLPLSPPTLPPQSWLWCAVGTPPQTTTKTLEFSLCSFLQALRSRVWRPPHDLVSPFDAGQVPSRPPYPSHMHFWSHAFSSPCQAHSPGLHFLEVVFVRVGTSAQKGSLPLSPPLLCCFC